MLAKDKESRILRNVCIAFGAFIIVLFVLSEIRTRDYEPLFVKGLDAIKFPLGVFLGIIAGFYSPRALSEFENQRKTKQQKAYLRSIALVIRDNLVMARDKAEKFGITKGIVDPKNITQAHINNIKKPDYAFQRVSDFLESCELFCTKFIEFQKNDDLLSIVIGGDKNMRKYESIDHLAGSIIQKVRSIRQHIDENQYSELDNFHKAHVVRAIYSQIPKALREIEHALRALGHTGPFPEPDPL